MNNQMSNFVSIAIVLCAMVALASATDRRIIGKRQFPPAGWELRGPARAGDVLHLVVELRTRNDEWLARTLEQVSDFKSPHYGKYKELKEIRQMIAPSERSYERVYAWLSQSGHQDFSPLSVKKMLTSVHVTTTIEVAERMLGTSFHRFSSVEESDRVAIKQLGHFSVPSELDEHVAHVFGASEFLPAKRTRAQISQLADVESKRLAADMHKAAATGDVKYNGERTVVTPDVLRDWYTIDSSLRSSVNQSFFNDLQWFVPEALDVFCKIGALPNTGCGVSKIIGYNCLNGPLAGTCTNALAGEAQLDAQTLTAIASHASSSDAGTQYWNPATTLAQELQESLWILTWAQQVVAQQGPNIEAPQVHSVSYGFPSIEQCLVAQTACSTLGYNAKEYIEAVDKQFQIFGTRGWTVVVSSGDDGAQAFGQNYPVEPKSTTVNQLTIDNGKFKCMFPSGADNSLQCGQVLRQLGQGNDTEQGPNCAVSWTSYYSNPPSGCNIEITNGAMKPERLENGSFVLPHMTSSCSVSQYPRKDFSNGCSIYPWTYDEKNGPPFLADYPTSSAFCLSCGATQFSGSTPGKENTNEIVASSKTGSLITSGGGFAVYHARPSWQDAAVSHYLSTGDLPPQGTFPSANRGYPDVSALGHSYAVVMASVLKNGTEEIGVGLVDGTSASVCFFFFFNLPLFLTFLFFFFFFF
jgi:Pro-kumamolisin, activation domain